MRWVDAAAVRSTVSERGLILSVVIGDCGHEWVLWIVHNFVTSDAPTAAVRDEIATRPPLAVVDIFGGDFNFIDENDMVLHTCGDPRFAHPALRRRQREWTSILATCIEVAIDDVTY